MPCIFYGVTIDGDTTGSKNNYENGKIYEAITRVVKGNAKTFAAVATFFTESSNSAFRTKLFNLLGEQDKKKFQSAEELNNTAIANNVNINTIVKAIKSYAVETLGYSDIENSKTNGQRLFGFDTVSAKETAKKYTADVIKNRYYNALFNRRNLTSAEIKYANGTINDPRIASLLSCIDIEEEFYRALYINDDIINYNNGSIIENIKNYFKNPKERKVLKESIITELAKYFEDNKGAIKTKIGQYYQLFKNVLNDEQALRSGNTAEWLDEVCGLKSMSKIVEDIKTKGHIKEIEDYNEEEDSNNSSVLEEIGNEIATNTWDKVKVKASSYFKEDFKLYLDTIYKSDVPYTGDVNNPIPYSTNNELGVKETYGSDFIIQQLVANAVESNAFCSPEAFIKMIEKLASSNKELYGFGTIANDMKKDSTIKHKIFSQLSKNPYTKVQIDIRNIESPTTRISNAEFNSELKLIYSLRNIIKSTASNVYNEPEVNNVVNKINGLDTIKPEYRKGTINLIVNFISNYIPTIDKDNIYNFVSTIFDNRDNRNIVLNFIKDISEYGKNIRKQLNDVNQIYHKAISDYRKINPYAFDAKSKIHRDYSNVKYDAINNKQSLVNFAKKLLKDKIKDIKLTSYNAEDSMSSNIGDNNRLHWIVTQLNTIDSNFEQGNKTAAKLGLQNLLNSIKDIPQYKHSIFFFGIHNRKMNVEGLFGVRADGSYYISDIAQDLIRFHLFDGIKNHINNNGVLWNNMTRGDTFITMLESYTKPVNTYDYVNDTVYQTLEQRAGYFLPVPADMPKNAIMQYRKFNTNTLLNENGTFNPNSEVFIALKELVLGELQCMIDTAYVLSEKQEGNGNEVSKYIIKNNTKNKFDYYHFINKMIDDNGKLTGNVFKFQRLFNVGFDVNEAIINALSLYGGGNQSLFTFNKNNDSITINNVNWINPNTHNVDNNIIDENINNIIGQWLNSFYTYCAKANEEFTKLEGNRYTLDNVVDMGLNYIIANEVYNSIIIGDTKFYKDAGTIIKRAKEELAGGTSYGSYDSTKDIFVNEKLHCDDILKEIGITNGPVIEERTGFNAVTAYNTHRASPELDRIRQDLRNEGKDEETIIKLTKKFEDGKINDAQSYITFEEWIRRMYAIGELNQYKDLIQRIIDAKEDENGNYDINLEGINERIQVQKNYYFDLMRDDKTKCIYPRQIKNAEFVLIPKLLPKGSELLDIYNKMIEKGISQINTFETSKAATREVITIWDNNGKYNSNWANNNITDNVDTFFYRSLYRQQEIPQHMVDTSNKFGIQISKKIIDNVSTADDNVKNAVNEYFAAYQKMVQNTFETFIYDMGWKINKKDDTIVNKNGNPLTKKDYIKFLEQGKKEAQRLGLDSNFIEYWQTDENGETVMPNWFNNVSKKLQSVAQSMFNNNITRQKMPGFHAALVSDMGYGEKLRYRVVSKDKAGNRIVYSEVRVPYWFKKVYKEKLRTETGFDVSKLSDNELLDKLNEAELNTHIWYFMPTEGKQSMAVVKVVGFLPEAYGSTAMAPEELIVEQGGKDFDSDTIYDMSYNFDIAYKEEGNKKDKNSEYKATFYKFVKYKLEGKADKDTDYMEAFKSHYSELGIDIEKLNDKERAIEYNKWLKKALQNKILSSMITILSSPSSTEENLMGSQFEDIKNASAKWDNLRGQSVKHTPNIANIFDEVQYRDNAMSGAELKAMSVNRDTLCSLSNKAQAILSDKNEIAVLYDTNKYNIKELKDRFGNATEVKLNDKYYIKVLHNRFGWSTDNKNVDGSLITVYSSETTAHILDALKEGAIYNENKFTFRVFKTLVDLGSNYDTAIGFLSSPGVSNLVNAWNEKNSLFSEDNSVILYSALRNLLKNNGFKVNEYTPAKNIRELIFNNKNIKTYIESIVGDIKSADNLFKIKMPLSADLFENRLSNDTNNSIENLAFDILTMITFSNIDTIASNIEDIAQCTNPDKFGAKTSIYETRIIIDKINDGINNKNSILKVKKVNINGEVVKDENRNDVYVPFLAGLYGEVSFFPHLKSIYQYATKSSVDINRVMFEMESEEMNEVTDELGVLLNKTLSAEEYNRFCRFIIARLYKYSQLLSLPITVNNNNKITIDTNMINDIMEDNEKTPVEREYLRISGIEETETIFTIEDINNPTEEELIKFNKLTPAQKVLMINSLFKGRAELFNILNAETINEYNLKEKGYNINKVSYTDGVYINDDLINRFRNAFNNNNKLIRLAAIDLIKYAFVVEGFNFKSGNISKIVPNDCMLRFSDDGINNIITEIKDAMKLYYNENANPRMSLYDDYVRSHSDLIRAVKLKDKALEEFNKSRIDAINKSELSQHNGVRYIGGKDNEELRVALGFSDYTTPNYVRIKRRVNVNGVNTDNYVLYKIQVVNNSKNNTYDIFMYPLNLLESNELEGISNNTKNNEFYKPIYYKTIINDYLSEVPQIVKQSDITDTENAIKQLRSDNIINSDRENELIKMASDSNFIMNNAKNANPITAAKYNTFVKKINNALSENKISANKSILTYPDFTIKNKFEIGIPVIQNIEIDGKILPVKITKYKYSSRKTHMSDIDKYYFWSINKYKDLNVSEDAYNKLAERVSLTNPTEMKVINEAVRSLQFGIDNFFTVELMQSEEDARQEKQELDNAKKALDNERLSSTIDIEDIEDDYSNGTTAETVARVIIDNIRRTSVEELNEAAIKFRQKINKLGINEYSLSSISNNKSNIYKAANTYYKFLYDYLSAGLIRFKGSNGIEYNLGDKAFYEHLVKEGTEKEVQDAIKILLEAKTFGSTIDSIRDIELFGEDVETANYIKNIIKYINDIKQMNSINDGIKYMFNIYYAKKYSNNPLIKLGIIKLNENFDDISILDKWFSDVTELPNKEIQVLTNLIQGIIGEAQRIKTPDAIAKFRKDVNNITGGKNIGTKYIDENGKFIQEYNNEFKEKLEHYEEAVNNAIEKGTTSKEYVFAKLALDKFNAINRHQKANQQFYLDDVKLRENVIKDAGDLYFNYLKLNEELSSFDNSSLTDEETLIKKWEIKRQIENLFSEVNLDGTKKFEEDINKGKALNKYLKDSRRLRTQYWKVSDIGEFNEYVKYYTSIIEKIEKEHPRLTLNKLLKIPEYYEARQWLFENARLSADEGIRNEVEDARSILYGDSKKSNNSVLAKLKQEKNRYDALGTIDGTKFTPEEVDAIKREYEEIYNERQDKSLIKATNPNTNVYTKEFYELFKGKYTDEQIEERQKLFARANAILRKGLKDSKLDLDTLFHPIYGVTSEELKELGDIYSELRSIKAERTDTEKGFLNKEITFNSDEETFNQWKQYYEENLKNRFDAGDFYDIICNSYVTKNGTKIRDVNKPNTSLFGFAKPINENKYIDKERTNARKVIAQYTRKVTTRYYDIEKAKHKKDTNWFDRNHIYNSNTGEYEPLPIWTNMEIGDGTYHYEPKNDFAYSEVIEGKEDKDYQKNGSYNYNPSTGNYTNAKWTALTNEEKQLSKLMQNTIKQYNFDYSVTNRIKEGFAPRKYKTPNDKGEVAKHTAIQMLKILGLNWSIEPTSYDANVDYSQHRELPFTMFNPLRLKESKDRLEQPVKTNDMTDAQYNDAIKEWKKKNKEIDDYNLSIEKAYLDRDYVKLFEEFIAKSIEYEARNKAKNSAFLLLEELKNGKSIKTNRNGEVILRRFKDITDKQETLKEDNANAIQSIQNWINRVIYTQYREEHKGDAIWKFLQSQTSARYMVANVRGGIANISTGIANILGESFGNYYFNNNHFRQGLHNYNTNVLSMIGDSYGLTATSLYSAIAKRFDIVEYDNALKDIQQGKNLDEVLSKFNDTLYICQTGGEHMMQNSTLFAMIKSYRVCDIDGKGTYDVMSEEQYIQESEFNSLPKALESYKDGKYVALYKEFIDDIRKDPNKKKAYDRFKQTITQSFIKSINDKEFTKYFIKTRNAEIELAKKRFNNFETIESQLELKDGLCMIKENSNFTNEMFGKFRREVQSVNNYIHGVYNKDGAAYIEKYAWGSLIMQYRKHIYPGIMKRYRGVIGRAMYNESRRAINKGSYVSLAQFIATEFINLDINEKDKTALKYIQAILRAFLDTFANLKLNWQTLDRWEQSNIRRALTDFGYMIGLMSMTGMFYAMFDDDDDIKDSNFYSSILYLLDKCFTEVAMYTPRGLYTEAQTAIKNPFAAWNGIEDTTKLAADVWDYFIGADRSLRYQSGQYKGEAKPVVYLKKNIPLYRQINAYQHRAKNNNYYRIGDNNINLVLPKQIVYGKER